MPLGAGTGQEEQSTQSAAFEKFETPKCYGNACSRCGKCLDWCYTGDFDLDYERFNRLESYDILQERRWHRRPDGPSVTCSYFYGDHLGATGAMYGFDLCRCGCFCRS